MDIEAHIRKSSKQDRSGFNGEDCFQQRNSKLSRIEEQEQEQEDFKTMRSASLLPSSEQMLSFSDDSKNTTTTTNLSPYLLPQPYSRTSVGGGGYGYGGMMMSMQGKGPFTLTQWAELEHQALIYKYITANVPVPSSLLISIKKSFYPYGSLPPSSFGWGTFHLGFAGGNMDPEPGRCRRTDGKKWRCSRDAVPDQKYCERHINRGRHRSRKLVEVQQSAASKAVTTTTPQVANSNNNNNNKSNTTRAAASSNRSLAIGTHQYNSVRNPLESSVYPPQESPVVHQKQNNNPFAFGHISSDSLLNPNTVSSSYLDFSSHQDKQHSENHNPWPPEELKPDWTQLSMSIPIASSSSSPSSTHNNNNNNNKTALSPLRLSSRSEFDFEEEPVVRKVNTWIPISWGNSLGGPLGEVLNSTGSSPTGVLQKSTFCSLSNNSSYLSSPISENNHNRNNNGECFLHYTT